MKITVDSKAFLDACSKVEKASASKTTIPALEGILIKSVNSDEISLCCFDLELAIVATLSAEVEGDVNFCINAKTLINIIKQTTGTVVIESESKQKYSIKDEHCNYSIMSYDIDTYPEIPMTEAEESFDINQKDFSDMIKQSIFAVSTDATKGAHTGIKFEVRKNMLNLVALDGYRFAVRSHEIIYFDNDIDFVVPSKTMNEVKNISLSKDEDITVEKCKHHVMFTVGNSYKVISKLQTGDFLDYRRAMPATNKFSVNLSPTDFGIDIGRCAVVIDEKFKTPIKLCFEKNKLTLLAETPIGNAKIDSSVNYTDEEGFMIGLNHKYLKEAIDACKEDEEIKVSFLTPTSPVTIEAKDKTYLILAVRI